MIRWQCIRGQTAVGIWRQYPSCLDIATVSLCHDIATVWYGPYMSGAKTIKRRIRRPKDLGRALWQARDQEQLSQKALSERTGLYRQFISQMENGHVSISVRHLLKLISDLGYTIELHPQHEPDFDLEEHIANVTERKPSVDNTPKTVIGAP